MEWRKAVVGGVAGVLLALGGSAASMSQPTAQGESEALFAARCKSCHEPPIARAPSREQLRGRTNQEIVEALTTGVMQPMAAGMTRRRSSTSRPT